MTRRFDPKEDITAYELAVIFSNVSANPLGGPLKNQDVVFTREQWDALPDTIKRHWR